MSNLVVVYAHHHLDHQCRHDGQIRVEYYHVDTGSITPVTPVCVDRQTELKMVRWDEKWVSAEWEALYGAAYDDWANGGQD